MAKVRWVGLGAVLTYAVPALAAPPTRELARCMAIDEPSARLICYDQALARPVSAPKLGEAPRMPVATAAVSPAMTRSATPRAASIPSTVDARLTAIVPIGDDLFRFQLSDGSVWRTGEQSQVRPVLGEIVHIRRSMLTYYAAIGGRASIGVRPVR